MSPVLAGWTCVQIALRRCWLLWGWALPWRASGNPVSGHRDASQQDCLHSYEQWKPHMYCPIGGVFATYLIGLQCQPSDLFVRNAKHRKCVVHADGSKLCSVSGKIISKGGVMTALNHTEEMVTWCGRCKCNQATSLSKRPVEFVHILQGVRLFWPFVA